MPFQTSRFLRKKKFKSCESALTDKMLSPERPPNHKENDAKHIDLELDLDEAIVDDAEEYVHTYIPV